MTDAYCDERPHPFGLQDNPEWAATRAKRADLYLAERARRQPAQRPDPVDQFYAFIRGFWS